MLTMKFNGNGLIKCESFTNLQRKCSASRTRFTEITEFSEFKK